MEKSYVIDWCGGMWILNKTWQNSRKRERKEGGHCEIEKPINVA